jgi:CheY-like chemotaxis protein
MADRVLSGRHILVVEDEMMILKLIEDYLADLGASVAAAAAATVDQALALINTQVFDVAMLDVNLNGSKSHLVAETLAARGVPFIFSTGYVDHALTGGYRDRPVLKKPFRAQELVDCIRLLIE